MHRPSLRRPHPAHTIPAAALITLAIFGGCTTADPYYIDPRPFEVAASAPIPALNEREVWVTPIQIRRSHQGSDWLDLLVAGRNGAHAAYKWAQTPRGSSSINAVVTLRRVTPDPAPIRLDTHGSLNAVARPTAQSRAWTQVDPAAQLERLVLSIPLNPRDRLKGGRYELRLVVPSLNDTAIWTLPDTDVILDERPIQFDLSE
ncbi:MAG TPA: hypothetical protein VFF65_07370 [Phycisphaerales bacterium]|nr:hypothetical protein [Phycisphaerales bacterium]